MGSYSPDIVWHCKKYKLNDADSQRTNVKTLFHTLGVHMKVKSWTSITLMCVFFLKDFLITPYHMLAKFPHFVIWIIFQWKTQLLSLSWQGRNVKNMLWAKQIQNILNIHCDELTHYHSDLFLHATYYTINSDILLGSGECGSKVVEMDTDNNSNPFNVHKSFLSSRQNKGRSGGRDKTAPLNQRDRKTIMWRCGGEVSRVLWGSWFPDNVDQVCCSL